MELFSVYGRIGLNDKEFNQGIAQAESKGQSFASKLGGAVAKGAAAIATAVLAVGTAAVAVGTQYDGAIATIQARTGMAESDTDRLGIAFRDMGLDGIFSATQIANAYASIAVTGQDATHGIGIMENAMTMARATGNQLGDTAYFLGNYLLKIGKDSTYAEKYINLFSQGIANTGIGLSDMQNYMFRMTPAFQQFGADGEVNVGILTRLYQAGIRGANLYSGMGSIMMEFGTQSGNAYDAVSDFARGVLGANYEAATNEERMFAAAQAMSEYQDQTKVAQIITESMNATQQAAWFEFMNLSTEIRDEVIPGLREATAATGEYGTAATMAQNQTLTFNQALGMAKNSGQDMLITIWDIVKTPLAGVLGTAAEKMRSLAMRLREGGDLHPVVKKLGEVITKLANIVINLVSGSIEPLLKILARLGTILITTIDLIIKFAPAIITLTAAFLGFKAAMAITAKIEAFKKVMGATSLATALQTQATNILTAAQAKQAAMTAKQAASMGLLATFKGVFAGITKVATASVIAFMVALKNVPVIGWILAAISALIAGIALLVKWFNRETDASRETREETARLAKEREEATKRANELADAVKKSAEAHDERIRSMEAEITVSRSLINRIDELNSRTNLSAQEKAELAAKVQLLNENMGETVATINAETGRLNENVDAIRRRIDALGDEARATAQRERLIEVSKEQLRIEEELEHQRNRQTESYERFNAIQEEMNDGTRRTRQENLALQEALEEARTANHEAREAVEMLTESYERNEGSIETLTEAIIDNELALYDAANAADGYADGIDEATRRATESFVVMAELQADVLEGLAGEYETIKGRATDAFNEIDTSVSKSMENLAETLRKNAEATREWGNNTAEAMSRARELAEQGLLDEGMLGHLEELAARGPGYAEMLANATEAEIIELADAFADAGEASVEKLATVYGLDESVAQEAANMVNNTRTSMFDAVQEAGFDEVGIAAVRALADGIDAESAIAELAAAGVGEETLSGLKRVWNMNSPPQVFVDAGQAVPRAVAEGISGEASTAITAANTFGSDISSALENSITSSNFRGKALSMIQDFAQGIIGATPQPVNAIRSTMNDVSSAADTTITQSNYPAKGRGIVMELVDGILSRLQQARTAIMDIINEIASTADTRITASNFTAKGQLIVNELTSGMTNRESHATGESARIANAMNTSWDNTITANNYFAKGQNIINSLISGLQNRESALMAEAQRIANAIAATISAALQEGSPMKVFVRMGQKIPDSMAIGIDKNADNALKSANSLANNIIKMSDIYGNYGTVSSNSLYAARMANAGIIENNYAVHLNTRPMSPHEAMTAAKSQFELARWTA